MVLHGVGLEKVVQLKQILAGKLPQASTLTLTMAKEILRYLRHGICDAYDRRHCSCCKLGQLGQRFSSQANSSIRRRSIHYALHMSFLNGIAFIPSGGRAGGDRMIEVDGIR